MGSEYGKDGERRVGIPYDPEGPERVRLASEVRRMLVSRLGTDTVVRYKHRERYKVKLPEGEDLLKHVRFEHCGTYQGHEQITADVHLPCALPGGGIFDVDPYEDFLELRVPKRNPTEVRDDPEVPARPRERERAVAERVEHEIRRRQILAVVLVSGVILVGGALVHHGDRIRDWWKGDGQKNVEPPPRVNPPTQLPEPWIKY